MRPPDLPSLSVLADRNPHGTRIKYMGGCRCGECRAAAARSDRESKARRRQGLSNGLTSAEPTREHLLRLSSQGIGRDAVADVSGVAVSVISEIRTGRKQQIRKETERRILAVTVEAAFDKANIDAGPTWRLIGELLEEGFTKAELARRLGYAVPALPFRRERISARNARRIELLYRRVMQ